MSKFTKTIIMLLLAVLPVTVAGSDRVTVTSPDGKITVEYFYSDGRLKYRITNDGYEIITPSEIKWSVRDGGKLHLKDTYATDCTYATRGWHSTAHDHCNGAVIDAGGFCIEARAYNDGVAWRYTAENNGKASVADNTTLVLPDGVNVWSQPNVRNYEGTYSSRSIADYKKGERCGCLLTVEYPNGLYAATAEGGLDDFAGMSFKVSAPNTFRITTDGKSRISGNISTPWRIVTTGSLNTLVNSDIISSVSAPARISPSADWIRPGRCVWSWLTQKPDVTFDNMKRFSQLASELGFEYNLVDEGWSYWQNDGKDCWQLLRELVDYSDSLGVGIWVWKAYPDRNGIKGITSANERRAFLTKCKRAGVKGVKIDFFDSEKQEVDKFYMDALADAARLGLMISFHGSGKPAGQSRTYPNEMTREAIRGLENRPPWAKGNTTLPFTRMLAGHADFTPVIIQETNNTTAGGNRQSQRVGEVSVTHHFATAAIYNSPLLCLAVNPADLVNHPFRQMLTSIPPVWDETIVLPGSRIGSNALFARRHADEWFIAAVTVDGGSFDIPLTFLGNGKYNCTEMADKPGKPNEATGKEYAVDSTATLHITMDKAGGYLARIVPAAQ